MRRSILFIFLPLLLCRCAQNEYEEIIPTATRFTSETKAPKTFELYYSYAGLGSGFGSLGPVFRVKGLNYTYTLEQNSFYSQPDKKPEPVCEGTLRPSSVDSIIGLVKNIKDTLVYRTNVGIMSGGMHQISVSNDTINVNFRLHNADDPIARKIVNILNTNIPVDKQKLWLFNFPETNYDELLTPKTRKHP